MEPFEWYILCGAIFVVVVLVWLIFAKNPVAVLDQSTATSRQTIEEWRTASARQPTRWSCLPPVPGPLLLLGFLVCSFALGSTLAASFTCQFAKATDGRYIGVWRYEENDSSCVPWNSQSDDRQIDHRIQFVKAFSVMAIIVGSFVWVEILVAIFRGCTEYLIIGIIVCSCVCSGLNVGFMLLFKHESCQGNCTIDYDDETLTPQETCHGRCTSRFGAHMSIVSTTLWTALFLMLHCSDMFRGLTSGGHPTRQSSTIAPSNRRTTERRRTDTATPHEDGDEERGRIGQSDGEPLVTIWKDEKGRLKKSRRIERMDASGARIVETYIETLRPVGTPLVSVSEDDEGRLVRTTITEYVDQDGEKVVNKVKEVLETPSQEDDQSYIHYDEESEHDVVSMNARVPTDETKTNNAPTIETVENEDSETGSTGAEADVPNDSVESTTVPQVGASDSASQDDVDTWACSHCTLVNRSSLERCDACHIGRSPPIPRPASSRVAGIVNRLNNGGQGSSQAASSGSLSGSSSM